MSLRRAIGSLDKPVQKVHIVVLPFDSMGEHKMDLSSISHFAERRLLDPQNNICKV